jgi:hypothetical protein
MITSIARMVYELVPERVEEPRVVAEEHACDLPPDADHLVAVVRVEDAVRVRPEVVEHGEVVGGERADPARSRLPVQRAAALEARHRV